MKNPTGLATLITALVAAGGLVFTIIQYGIDTRNQEKVQKASYEATSKGLKELTDDVTSEFKTIHDEIQSMKIDVAVLRERTRHANISPAREGDVSMEVRIPKIRRQEIRAFSEVQKSALAE